MSTRCKTSTMTLRRWQPSLEEPDLFELTAMEVQIGAILWRGLPFDVWAAEHSGIEVLLSQNERWEAQEVLGE